MVCCALLCRFTRDAALLQLVGQVLLPSASQQPHKLTRWLVGRDAFALAEPETTKAIYDALSGERFPAVQEALGGPPSEVDVAGAIHCCCTDMPCHGGCTGAMVAACAAV